MEELLVHTPARVLGRDRTLTLPSLSLSPAELHAAAARLAPSLGVELGPPAGGGEAASRGAALLTRSAANRRAARGAGRAGDARGSRALKLGLLRDESADSIVGGYAEDYVVQGGSEREEVLS
ncbi:hypothetical protein EMIHUDRAFT_216800 [Emiliania huxleyi CCMP1516]|uniref:Uncharacterized protein n=2 Tax=Emiliania huxleyi TaxID=2903 RepID=A0A0D3ICL2_EMIH1|nr:hypothetical protein EMIHUDRAFT_216800 [Emiliania huxleyi CCMP1516]EOD08997.1 hypothetical protein EMIHUDRAFT_216800 [Emiliania huxleyi CCMP1516]|eukprot:XP_005761426.1 hypothetical protein EMIHUDRAFT_216800 [Emiliania huxleyi CCMP1516]